MIRPVSLFKLLQLGSLDDLPDVANPEALSRANLKGARWVSRPADVLNCRPPVGIEGYPERQTFFYGASNPELLVKPYPIGAAYLARLPFGRLVGPGCVVIGGDNQVFEQSFSSDHILAMGGHFQKQNLKIQLDGVSQPVPFVLQHRMGPPKHIAGPALLLTQYWQFNYHHWLAECLPRLALLKDDLCDGLLADIPVIVPAQMMDFQRQSLLELGLEESRWLPYDGSEWEVETLYFPSLGVFAPAELRWLRDRLRRPAASENARRIYISRQDATNRQLLNETEITGWLQQQGFEIHQLSGMAFGDQLDLFSNAEIIIGPHGAGLTNMIFAPPQATLIELMPADKVNHVFWLMANGLDLEYRFAVGQAQNSARDFYVDLEEVQHLLDDVIQ